MIYTIKNDFLTAKFNSFGAELISVANNKIDYEFIWQGNPEFWSGHSPVVFPFFGRLMDKKYTYKGEEYSIEIHGIAKYFEFKVYSQKEDEIEFILSANEETLKLYPFNFDLILGYKLDKETLVLSFTVINKDNNEMYFSYGGHPAFNVPLNKDGVFEDYYVEFGKDSYQRRTFGPHVLYNNQQVKFDVPNNKLPLRHDLFDDDAIFLEDGSDVVSIKKEGSNNYVKVSFEGMTVVGLWHAVKKAAPYVCIEPIHGFPGREETLEDIETKQEMIKLNGKSKFYNFYKIEFHVE